MEKEIKKLLEEIKIQKKYYKEATEAKETELAETIKHDIILLQKQIKILKKKQEKLKAVEREEKAVIKKTTNESKDVLKKTDKVKELEKKILEEKKREQQEKYLKLKEAEEQKKQEKKVEELRKKANLKELKYGTLLLLLGTISLVVLVIFNSIPYVLNSSFDITKYEKIPYYSLTRAYIIVLMIAFLVFTYVQTNLKNMLFLRIYVIVTMFLTFLGFEGIKYFVIENKPAIFQAGSGYILLPLLLLLVLIGILIKLLVRDKLPFQYVKKVED